MSSCIARSNAAIMISLPQSMKSAPVTAARARFMPARPSIYKYTQRISVRVHAKTEERETSTSSSPPATDSEPQDFWEVSKSYMQYIFLLLSSHL